MNMSLQFKIIGGFLFAVMISIAVGVVGWNSSSIIQKKMHRTGNIDLPALENILGIKQRQTEVKTSIQTILNPALNKVDRALEYEAIRGALEKASQHMNKFDALPKNDEVNNLWLEFKKSWLVWESDIKTGLELIHQIDAIAIDNPPKLAMAAEHYFGTYKAWTADVSKSVLESIKIDTNEEIESLAFGKWLTSLEVKNERVQKAQQQVIYELGEVLRATVNIADFIEIEEPDLAKDVYTAEVLPSIESIQMSVDNLMAPIEEALELYNHFHTFNKEKTEVSLQESKQILATIVSTTKEAVVKNIAAGDETGKKAKIILLSVILAGSSISLIFAYFFARSISVPVGKTMEMLNEMRRGHLDMRLKMIRKDEIGEMSRMMDRFADDLQNEVVAALEQLADGDLTFEANPKDEQDVIGIALKKSSEDLNKLVAEINSATGQIALGSNQVAASSQSLSMGATEQAASLEQITSSMKEMTSQTRTNAENASQANQLADEAQKAAKTGNNQMQNMVASMSEINEAGQNISKIIKVIDEIAFQTNLLALNAAVEAARAGRHGKGFAVVAEEVRTLAARSAKAAQETAELIEGSVQKTVNGTKIANQTATSLDEIVSAVSKVTDLVVEIAAASNEQAEGISQVNQGLGQIDRVTQKNTASAEQGASAAEELSSQTAHLKALISTFKVKGEVSVSGMRQNALPEPTPQQERTLGGIG